VRACGCGSSLQYSLSYPAVGSLAIAVAITCAGQTYVHRRFSDQDFVQHNEVGGFIIAVVGSLYAVVLGFLTLVVWQHFRAERELVILESAAAADAWHTAVGLPSTLQSRVRRDILNYSNDMIDHDWPAMRRGGFDSYADILVMDAMGAVGEFVPANMRESNAQAATLQQLSVLHDERLQRIAGNGSGVSWFEWLVLSIGAVCVICFCWLFGLRNAHTHLLMTSTVAVIIVSMLVLLFELQYPFRSDIGIGPDVWKATVEHIRLMQTSTQMNMKMY
jgi:hypothetical protein